MLLVANRKALCRHDNAMYLRRNGVSQVPEPHNNTFLQQLKENLALSLSHVMILLSGTGSDTAQSFWASIEPLMDTRKRAVHNYQANVNAKKIFVQKPRQRE